MAHIKGGWVGEGWGRQWGGWAAGGMLTAVATVCSVSDTNSPNPQDRPRQSLAAVWNHTHPY